MIFYTDKETVDEAITAMEKREVVKLEGEEKER